MGKVEPIVSGDDEIKTLSIALKIMNEIYEKYKETVKIG
jgi:hypothetical protein